MNSSKKFFGVIPTGEDINEYTLSNNDISIGIINYGGIITSLCVPDKNGKSTDIVLGYKTLEEYLKNAWSFGAIIGRVAGRIQDAKFKLNDKFYKLAKNENNNTHLHGGIKGFSKVVWDVEEFYTDSSVGIKLHYFSKDGEEGYPGNLNVTVQYELNNSNEFIINYSATTDKPTPVSLTNHSYLNLNGESSNKSVINHKLQIYSAHYVALDNNLAPLGIKKVDNTPLDFRSGMLVREKITDEFNGYDHVWLLDKIKKNLHNINVLNPDNGIKMEIFTNQPCVVCFTSNGMDGSMKGKKNTPYNNHAGLCLETQGVTDAVNHPEFPSIIISPEKPYIQNTIWKFSVND